MRPRHWLPASHHMVTIFAVVAVVSAVALGLLSWQLFDQNRQLETPRRRGVLEAAADEATKTLTVTMGQLDAALNHAGGTALPLGVSVVTITSDRTTFGSNASLPFVPTRSLREADAAIFAEATTLEFSKDGRDRARAAYEALSTHSDSAVRATALNRLGAMRRQSGDFAGALRAYDAMSALDDVGVGGLPAGLIATVGRASALKEADRQLEFRDAAAKLARGLSAGKWPLTAPEFEHYVTQASEWLGASEPREFDARFRAEATAWLWQQRPALAAAGRKLISVPPLFAVVVWRATNDGLEAVIVGPVLFSTLMSAAIPPGFAFNLSDSEGRPILNSAPKGRFAFLPDIGTDVGPTTAQLVATRAASEALPWTLQISAGTSDVFESDAAPQRLLSLVMSVMVVVLGAGWYFIARARGRELRVARLQNDFVAAVSHEFRSPLTSLAHIAELLAQNRMPGDAQRQQAYGVLVADTARLRELVEHLLDFGRFDSGTMALRFERVGIDAMVRDIVEDARQRVAALGYTIEFSPCTVPAFAEVDRVALGRAIWNLIDNAVKYSPDCRTVWVAVEHDESGTAITVRDQGLGIPVGEQAGIFERFVRGEESKSRRIKGTGIGLALVRQIVDAHGGEIELNSAVGQGSQFVVKLRSAGGVA